MHLSSPTASRVECIPSPFLSSHGECMAPPLSLSLYPRSAVVPVDWPPTYPVWRACQPGVTALRRLTAWAPACTPGRSGLAFPPAAAAAPCPPAWLFGRSPVALRAVGPPSRPLFLPSSLQLRLSSPPSSLQWQPPSPPRSLRLPRPWPACRQGHHSASSSGSRAARTQERPATKCGWLRMEVKARRRLRKKKGCCVAMAGRGGGRQRTLVVRYAAAQSLSFPR